MIEHTKGKVEIDKTTGNEDITIIGGKPLEYIAYIHLTGIADKLKTSRIANSKHLSKCWNSHDDLMDLLDNVINGVDNVQYQI